jgi:uncharacterized membrane protein YqjE
VVLWTFYREIEYGAPGVTRELIPEVTMTQNVSGVSDTKRDRSISQLVSDASEQLSRLARDEMRLATAEVQRKGKQLGAGARLAGVAGVLALLGAMSFVAAAILALAAVMPNWAAALVVGGALLVVAGLAAMIGRGQFKRAVPPVPEEAAASIQDDIKVLKESARS